MCSFFCRKYKPLVLEMKAWPSLNPKCSANHSPFDSPLLHGRILGKKHITPACATPKQPVAQLREATLMAMVQEHYEVDQVDLAAVILYLACRNYKVLSCISYMWHARFN